MSIEIILSFGGLILVVLVIPLSLVFWSKRRNTRKKNDELARIASEAGGKFIADPAGFQPLSSRVRLPFDGIYNSGFDDLMGSTRHTMWLSLQRGRWYVQVFETRHSSSAGPRDSSIHECLIEVPVSPLPTIKIGVAIPETKKRALGVTVSHTAVMQQTLDKTLTRPPTTAHTWNVVHLSPGYSESVQVFAEDPELAARTLSPQSLGWLVEYAGHLRAAITIEQGLVYLARIGELEPGSIVATVDTLVGFLDRVGAQPATS